MSILKSVLGTQNSESETPYSSVTSHVSRACLLYEIVPLSFFTYSNSNLPIDESKLGAEEGTLSILGVTKPIVRFRDEASVAS